MIILLFLEKSNKSLIDNFLNNNFMKYKLLLITLFACGLGWGQTWSYDFGTSTGTFTSSTASPSFLPTPTTGGGHQELESEQIRVQ
jgi:hypothetical protein